MPVASDPLNIASDHEFIGKLLPKTNGHHPRKKTKPNVGLTEQQRRFVDAMAAGEDRLSAAKTAGYGGKHVAITAWRLARHPKIVAALSARAEASARDAQVTPVYVLTSVREEIEYLKAKPERSAADSQAIFRGNELLGKSIALFRERIEEDRQITVTIQRIG